MNDRDSNNLDRIDFGSVPPASLLRAAADGELDAEGEARLGEHLDAFPADERRVAFDEGLRGACAGCMSNVEVPAGLRERITAGLAAESESENHALSDALAARAEHTRSPSFWQGTSGRVIGAMAATLLIAFSAVFAFRGLAGGPQDAEGYRVALAQFVANEHDRVANDERAASAKFAQQDRAAVLARLSGILGASPQMPATDGDALRFGGGARCRVPGDGPSTHFQFLVEAGDGVGPPARVPVSVFVKKGAGKLSLEEGKTYRVDTASCGVEASMFAYLREGLLYVVVAGGGSNGGCLKILDAMNVPAPSGDL